MARPLRIKYPGAWYHVMNRGRRYEAILSDSDSIISAVCEHYGVSFNELLITRRGNFNEPRNIAVYLLRQIHGENLNNIGEQFNIKAYSTVSSILRRVSKLNKYDRKIKTRIGRIQDSINKGQK
jgi:REP-associated tyrosine transposase